jgi:hypothetical protein
MPFASQTNTSVADSVRELEEFVRRAGGTSFESRLDGPRTGVTFELRGRRIAFALRLPVKEAFLQRKDRWGRALVNSPERQDQAWRQAGRAKWRALALCVKAKFVSIESGVETVDQAFLAHLEREG